MTSPVISPDSLVLAIDTATPTQSLAIVHQNSVLFEARIQSQSKEGPGLLSLLDAALKQCQIKLEDIDRFVVSRGPGAFTGLRVSMAMLKSLALTLNKPLYAASSLEAIARDNVPCMHILASCIDARRGEIYAAFYLYLDMTIQPLTEEMLFKPEDFVQYVQTHFPGQSIQCVGTAFPHYSNKLTTLSEQLCCRPSSPNAAMLAQIVLEKCPDSMPDIPLEALEPKYIRMDDFALPAPFDFSQPKQYRANHK